MNELYESKVKLHDTVDEWITGAVLVAMVLGAAAVILHFTGAVDWFIALWK